GPVALRWAFLSGIILSLPTPARTESSVLSHHRQALAREHPCQPRICRSFFPPSLPAAARAAVRYRSSTPAAPKLSTVPMAPTVTTRRTSRTTKARVGTPEGALTVCNPDDQSALCDSQRALRRPNCSSRNSAESIEFADHLVNAGLDRG